MLIRIFQGIAWAGFAAVCVGIGGCPWMNPAPLIFPGGAALFFGLFGQFTIQDARQAGGDR